jgi:hypothetical protein
MVNGRKDGSGWRYSIERKMQNYFYQYKYSRREKERVIKAIKITSKIIVVKRIQINE